MAEGQDAARDIISVTVKSTKDKKTIEIGANADIKEVKSCLKQSPGVCIRVFNWKSLLPAIGNAPHTFLSFSISTTLTTITRL